MLKRLAIALAIIPMMFLSFVFSAQASELNFSVSAVIPENQVDKKQTYFDLRMEPGQKQTVEVAMVNATDEDVTVEVNANTAITNNNGIVDYSQSDKEKDTSLTISLAEIVEVKEEITIPANSSKQLPITINMPDEKFDGVLLGGIHFQEKEEEMTDPDEDVQIKNKFAYVIGMKLTLNDVEVTPELTLNEVKPTQVNYRNVVTANLQNTEATIVKPLTVDGKIYKEKGKKVLIETKKEDLRMAPNSNFDFGISWEDQEFKSGTYRLEMTATDEDQTWEWTEIFTIDAGEAKGFNEIAVDIEKSYMLWYIIGGVFILLLLLALVFWLGRRTKKVFEDEVNE